MANPGLTDDQMLEALYAFDEAGGNKSEAARRLKMSVETYRNRLARAQAAFGENFRDELEARLADGFELQGYSQLTKTVGGDPIWLKTRKAERDYWATIKTAIENIKPVQSIPSAASLPDKDIIPWIQIGDGHMGMHCWEAETGANYDIAIAKREFLACTSALIEEAPPCERIVINDLGDGTHYENFKAMTEASGHAVDYDTRFPKMIEAYIDIICHTVDKALSRAQTVDCIFNQGNHSRTNDIWIAQLVRRLYGSTGRVNVLDNRNPFIAYRMGKTLVIVHHGDKVNPQRFRDVAISDFSLDWGEAEFRYLDGGHVHTKRAEELAGCTFESWNNLAPRDKYAHDGGWRSKQCMSLVLRSRTYGDVGRRTLPIERVRDLVLEADPTHYVPKPLRAFAA